MNFAIFVALDHEKLVHHEIETILGTNLNWKSDTIGITDGDPNQMQHLAKSSAAAKFILINPVEIEYNDLLNNQPVEQFENCLKWIDEEKDVQFRVTHRHVGFHNDRSKGDEIERNVGSWVWQSRPNLLVNLKNPTHTLMIFSSPQISIMGWCFKEIKYSRIAKRAPKFGPYFQGGNMKPRLCRMIVNLLQPLDAVILDPFAGHGGILREAADQNVFCIGIEISKKVMREFLANNRHFGYEDRIAVIHGDALHSPFRSSAFSSVVTDPPYAIQTTTIGLGSEELFIRWLNLQKRGVQIVFTLPDDILSKLPNSWKTLIDETDYVHGGLTRRIRKIRKVIP